MHSVLLAQRIVPINKHWGKVMCIFFAFFSNLWLNKPGNYTIHVCSVLCTIRIRRKYLGCKENPTHYTIQALPIRYSLLWMHAKSADTFDYSLLLLYFRFFFRHSQKFLYEVTINIYEQAYKHLLRHYTIYSCKWI